MAPATNDVAAATKGLLMPCQPIAFAGLRGIFCGSKRNPRQRCQCSSQRGSATLLCDAQIGPKRTCNAPLCNRCSTHIGPDTDLCRAHAEHHAEGLTGA